MLEEFKKSVMRGNAFGFTGRVIGDAGFGSIVSSRVAVFVLPIVGAIPLGFDFPNNDTAMFAKVQSELSHAGAKMLGAVPGPGVILC